MYQILIEKKARKLFQKFPDEIKVRIDKAITSLASEPRPANCKNLRKANTIGLEFLITG